MFLRTYLSPKEKLCYKHQILTTKFLIFIFIVLGIISCQNEDLLYLSADEKLSKTEESNNDSRIELNHEQLLLDPDYIHIDNILNFGNEESFGASYEDLVFETHRSVKIIYENERDYSFTFAIDSRDKNLIKNAIVESKNDSIIVRVIEYEIQDSILTNLMMQEAENDINAPIDLYTVSTADETNLRGCTSILVVTVIPCTCNNQNTGVPYLHTDPSLCVCSSPPMIIHTETIFCDGEEGNTVPIYETDAQYDTGTGTGGHGTGNNGSGGPSIGDDGMGTEFIMPKRNLYNLWITRFKNDNNLDISIDDLKEMIPFYCMNVEPFNVTNFNLCALEEIANFMSSSQTEYSQLFDFLISDNTGAISYIFDVYDLKSTFPATRLDRSIDLFELLVDEPNALFEFCTEDNDLSIWNDLLAFDIPQSCEDKIEDLGFENQPIETGDANTVNLDYYSVTFEGLPTNPNTDEEFDDIKSCFDYFRKNLPNFIDWDITRFQFLDPPLDDIQQWESIDPLTSVFTINIPVAGNDYTGDDGSVICSDFQDCCASSGHWVFSTIEAPDWGSGGANDGTHPVSGNRQFGFTENQDGTYTFYTKGADRANIFNFFSLADFTNDFLTNEVYNGGDRCWNSLMDGITEFVGASSVTETYRNGQNLKPKWETIIELLSSLDPITDIPCE